MRNKNTVIALLIVFVAICSYNLFYTFRQFNLDAERSAKLKPYQSAQLKLDAKEALTADDSLALKEYESLLNDSDFQSSYKTATERSFTLGLDLQGGMFVTLEVGIEGVMRKLAGDSKDEDFDKALKCATERSGEQAQAYVPLFVQCFSEIAPDKKLGAIFADPERGISIGTPNDEVQTILEEEANSAIDRTFDVIRKRIDQFGVVSPNLQKQPSTGRILLELPGVKDPDRVRELLRNTAKLEFWTTQSWVDAYPVLGEIDTYLAREAGVLDTTVVDSANADVDPAADDTEAVADSNNLAVADDSTTDDSSLSSSSALGEEDEETSLDGPTDEEIAQFRREHPLLGRLNLIPTQQRIDEFSPVIGQAAVGDTAAINEFLKREDIQDIIPVDMMFSWSFQPIIAENGGTYYNMYAIRTNEEGTPALEGDVVVQARQDFDPQNANQSVVSLSMNTAGAEEWGKITTANTGKYVAILLDGFAYSVPRVNGPINDGNTQIQGDFTIEEAEDLANVLKAGKLPAPPRIAGEETVGPTLGEENISRGLNSFLAAFIVTLIFMALYYAKAGIVADLALLANLIFILGCSAAFTIVLTLPGIAAVVLTVGMAVDANVLIFERIREEQAKGKTLKASIKAGFANAFSSVMDANITTFLTGVVLYSFGVGPIRGFAVSLMIGIITSLISALIITRLILDYYANRGGESLNFGFSWSTGVFDKLKINMVARRKTFYMVSGAVVLAALLSIGTIGFKYGVDFDGGRMYKISFLDADSTSNYPLENSEIEDLRGSLITAFENNEPVVKTVSNNNQLMITTSYRKDDREATKEVQDILVNTSKSTIASTTVRIDEVQDVGPTVANDIRTAAIFSVVFSLLIIFFYILMRFRKWQYSLGAIVAIFHDVAIVLGIFSILKLFDNLPINVEINQAMIAALLTIVGYSINDTVVVFDRIRENLGEMKSVKISDVYNISIDQTISRTLITSLTTFLTALILFIFGGDSIKGFIFGIMLGIIVGTYSSIFVASPIALDMIRRQKPELDN
ncbi:MAG: protein translocase subunit SecDF [Bacteroidota bacterium]